MDEAATAALLDAAERLIGERGLHEVGVEEIAAAAGVDPAHAAAEFPDTGALLVRLVGVRGHELRVALRKAVEGLGSRSMMEGAGFDAYFEWIFDHPHMYRLVRLSEMVDREAFRSWYRELASDYARGLRSAMDDGEVANADAEALAWCLMGMGDLVGMRYVLWAGQRQLPTEALRTFHRVVTRALAAGGPGR